MNLLEEKILALSIKYPPRINKKSFMESNFISNE